MPAPTAAPATAASLAALLQEGQRAAQAGRLDAAAAAFRAAVALAPRQAAAHACLALLLLQRAAWEEATPHLEAALGAPDAAPGLLVALARSLVQRRALDPAVRCLDRALALDPRHAEALVQRAQLHAEAQELDAAVAVADRALAVRESADAHAARALALECRLDVAAAGAHFARALALEPGHRTARRGLAYNLLLRGELDDGWATYRRRHLDPLVHTRGRTLRTPRWAGREPLAGRRLLVLAEEGLGDQLQCARFAARLAAAGARVHWECDAPLARLLATVPGVESVVRFGDPLPEHDLHVPALDLLPILATDEAAMASTPYVTPPGVPSSALAARLAELAAAAPAAATRVGLVWAGNPAHVNDRARSLPVEALAALRGLPGVAFAALQRDAAPGALACLTSALAAPVADLGGALDDLADTAHAIAALDLVVTVDTSVAHLAGAMGRPVWLLLPFRPDWRWGLGRTDTPWYASARLFRQPAPGDWPPVLRAVRAALAA